MGMDWVRLYARPSRGLGGLPMARLRLSRGRLLVTALTFAAAALTPLGADSTAYNTDPKSVPGANGASGADLGLALFAVADANTDNSVSRAELKATLETFLADADTAKAGMVTADQLAGGV